MWLFKKQQLLIYQIQAGDYQLTSESRYFPGFELQGLNLHGAIARCVEMAYDRNTSTAIRHLKHQLATLSC